MRKSLIALLSASLLFVLTLTVSTGSYGTTDHDVEYSIENPVYTSDFTFEELQIDAINGELSTPITFEVGNDMLPPSVTINWCLCDNRPILAAMDEAYYKQDSKSLYTNSFKTPIQEIILFYG